MTDPVPATPEQAHALLFDEILTLEETRAAAFVPQALAPSAVDGLLGRAESLLRALAVIDDGIGRGDDPDQPPDPALLRLEAKLDLLTLLVADLAGGQAAQDAQRALRWSARGVELVLDQAAQPGTQGVFRVRASDWLPSPLVLPAQVVAAAPDAAGTRAWLAFAPSSPALEAALERHVFRIHRRDIAQRRRVT
ncbi:PilZ domain-containing protein [Pseudoxanthomonas winnipegensis]|uniref:PilZ domain-containing protein n=1 Tax=Pseudoxanthomonas winnipegensis TaxID=2480810 RepID=UPI00102D6E91|nr:PilZ domain-containing protein [Pseudoxanthomonas winnipegensis]TAA44167.1 PilZ domain-containing protein [Pseudoxanthomonas winnipegensis]